MESHSTYVAYCLAFSFSNFVNRLCFVCVSSCFPALGLEKTSLKFLFEESVPEAYPKTANL